MKVLFTFLRHFLNLLSRCGSYMCEIAMNYPQSFSMAQKCVGLLSQSFEQFVVCPPCHTIYNFDNCVIKTYDGKEKSAKCKHVQFPNHPQAQFRKECGEDLLKHVKGNRTKGSSVQAKKQYCYQNLKDALTILINRPHFLEKCDHWRKRVVDEELLSTMEKFGRNFKHLMKNPFYLFQII